MLSTKCNKSRCTSKVRVLPITGTLNEEAKWNTTHIHTYIQTYIHTHIHTCRKVANIIRGDKHPMAVQINTWSTIKFQQVRMQQSWWAQFVIPLQSQPCLCLCLLFFVHTTRSLPFRMTNRQPSHMSFREDLTLYSLCCCSSGCREQYNVAEGLGKEWPVTNEYKHSCSFYLPLLQHWHHKNEKKNYLNNSKQE